MVRRAAVGFVLTTAFLDALGIGLIIPIVPELVRRLSGRDASDASLAVAALVATFALAQLLASPLLGGLSDRFGRRPVLLLSISGLAANCLFLAWAPSLPWLFLGRMLAGITAANVSTANAYIADISQPGDRARRFGLLAAVASFGFVVGPALGGVLGAINLRLPFIAAASLAGVNALYGLFVLPESLPPEHRRRLTWKGLNPVSALRLLGSEAATLRLAVCWGCFWFALGTLQTVFVLSSSLRFGWGSLPNGAAFTLFGGAGAVVQGVVVRRVVAHLGERRTAMAGYAISVVAYLVFAVASAGWMLYAAIVLTALGAVANPAVRALLSTRAGPDRQGRMMGAISSVEGLVAIVTPFLASMLFARFSDPAYFFPGAPFVAVAAAYVLAFAVIRGVR